MTSTHRRNICWIFVVVLFSSENHAETVVFKCYVRTLVEAACRAKFAGRVQPAAAAENYAAVAVKANVVGNRIGGIGFVFVEAIFIGVTVHVVETVAVGLKRTYFDGRLGVGDRFILGVDAILGVSAEEELGHALNHVFAVADAIGRLSVWPPRAAYSH